MWMARRCAMYKIRICDELLRTPRTQEALESLCKKYKPKNIFEKIKEKKEKELKMENKSQKEVPNFEEIKMKHKCRETMISQLRESLDESKVEEIQKRVKVDFLYELEMGLLKEGMLKQAKLDYISNSIAKRIASGQIDIGEQIENINIDDILP